MNNLNFICLYFNQKGIDFAVPSKLNKEHGRMENQESHLNHQELK
jgi:hypothetical protein